MSGQSNPTSPRSLTRENELADKVTSISRQLLDSFAFSQVDNTVSDLAHMRKYLVSKLPNPQTRPLELNPVEVGESAEADPRTILAEYKGALYSRRCLATQKIVLEYLLGRCLQQCQVCLEELKQTRIASEKTEESTDYVFRHGEERGVRIDVEGVDSESGNLFKEVRRDLYELGEEMRDLEGSREVAEAFLSDPESVLNPSG